MRKIFLGLATAALIATGSAAQAAVTFTLTGNTGTSGTAGNSIEFTGSDGITKVRVFAGSINGSTVQNSYLGAYSNGLGATSGDETGANNTHVLDNQNRLDFLLFQFNRPVNFLSATFTTFSVNGITSDSDAQIRYGTTNTVNYTNQTAFATLLNNTTVASLNGLFSTTVDSAGTSAGGNRAFGANGIGVGNLWLVSAAPADLCSTNCTSVDGFKFSTLSVAVPEPITWAMMIGGFGMVGYVMRNRRRLMLTFKPAA